jgi:hypothetical protein
MRRGILKYKEAPKPAVGVNFTEKQAPKRNSVDETDPAAKQNIEE